MSKAQQPPAATANYCLPVSHSTLNFTSRPRSTEELEAPNYKPTHSPACSQNGTQPGGKSRSSPACWHDQMHAVSGAATALVSDDDVQLSDLRPGFTKHMALLLLSPTMHVDQSSPSDMRPG